LKAFWQKEEEEEEVQRDSEVVKDCIVKVVQDYFKCKTKSCFYRLFMSGQENH